MKKSSIGRMAVVKHKNRFYDVSIMDLIHKTNRPKRVRVQSKGKLQGEVLLPCQYVLVEFV